MPDIVEQVSPDGDILLDVDTVLAPAELRSLLAGLAGLQLSSETNPYRATFKDREVTLCVKNVTYLGRPHPHYKKRIQISSAFKEHLNKPSGFLLGVYTYQGAHTFCLFGASTYKDNKLNNSSAHVSVLDLSKARTHGMFEKIDKRSNKLLVFAEEYFETAFGSALAGTELELPEEIAIVKTIFESLPRELLGTDAIQEMLDAGDPKALEGEWAGFFVEHYVKRFLEDNPHLKEQCVFTQNKRTGGMDLDMLFRGKHFPGDLKAHSVGSGIQGNDKATIERAIEQYGKVWYIVLGHTTVKDRDMDGVTTLFWNSLINKRSKQSGKKAKKDDDSYLDRMKYSVRFRHLLILEITPANYKYVRTYNQGKNSDGSERNPKISINKNDIDNFAIFRLNLNGDKA